MSDDTPTRVLHAAGPVFARKGFEHTTVREICAQANANLASVNYHFRDKQSLYREVVRLAHRLRLEQVPPPEMPADIGREEKLRRYVHTMLSRMLGVGEAGWQTQLLLREMLHPTEACAEVVEDFIRPQLKQLLAIVAEFVPDETPIHRRQQVAFSIVGQCLHYRVAREFVALLIPVDERERHFTLEQLAEHISQFSLAALEHINV